MQTLGVELVKLSGGTGKEGQLAPRVHAFEPDQAHGDQCGYDSFQKIEEEAGDAVFKRILADSLIVGVVSDQLFPVAQQYALYQKLIDHGCSAQFIQSESPYGHDAFYTDITIAEEISAFLQNSQ